MGEYKLELGIETKQFFLFSHNEVVSAFSIVTASLVIIGGLCPDAFFINGEIATMYFRSIRTQIHFIK